MYVTFAQQHYPESFKRLYECLHIALLSSVGEPAHHQRHAKHRTSHEKGTTNRYNIPTFLVHTLPSQDSLNLLVASCHLQSIHHIPTAVQQYVQCNTL